MAKRRHGQEAELPFVALMDTMTNVVGVLTIVLVMMGISIAHAVRKILSELPPATAAQVAQAQSSLDQLRQQKKAAEATIAALPKPQPKDAMEAELVRLEAQVKDKNIKLFDLDSLRKETVARTAELDRKQAELAALITERNRLKALLDSTPAIKPPAGKVVRIPNSRDIPANAELYFCYVRNDQVYVVDPVTAKKMVMDEFGRQKNYFIRQRIKVPRAADRIIYDQTKVVNYFAGKNLVIRGQKITVPENKYGNALLYQIDFSGGKGDVSLEEMGKPNNRFQAIAYKLSSYPRIALIFRIQPSGFETYLQAREIADAQRIPCGWEVDYSTIFKGRLDFEVNRLADPPPAPPQQPGSDPPPPKRRLD